MQPAGGAALETKKAQIVSGVTLRAGIPAYAMIFLNVSTACIIHAAV